MQLVVNNLPSIETNLGKTGLLDGINFIKVKLKTQNLITTQDTVIVRYITSYIWYFAGT